jgi:3-hydroxyisobutyrate dehydrogenase-like beta-hydroxyacid dehydrogenase
MSEMPTKISTIAMVGVGKTGLPMATRLLKVGYSVKVFDPSLERMKLARSEGLICASDIADCMNQAEVALRLAN